MYILSSEELAHDVYTILKKCFEQDYDQFEAALEILKSTSFCYWLELAYRCTDTDYEVNDLLKELAGDKYLTHDEDDNQIYNTIYSLDFDELREFIRGCIDIDEG
jgi:hypothetical protein